MFVNEVLKHIHRIAGQKKSIGVAGLDLPHVKILPGKRTSRAMAPSGRL